MSQPESFTPLWTPSKERISKTRLTDFVRFAKAHYPDVPEAYQPLHQWSVQNKEQFWSLIWDYFGVKGKKGSSPYLENADAMPGAKWFPSASLNFAENLLSRSNDEPAIISYKETGERIEISWSELNRKVAQLAATLKRLGVEKGDRVAAFLPNCAESVIGMLAASSIGAIWSSCSPDFGLQGVLDRFGQIKPKVLLACNGYYYNGKVIDTRSRVSEITQSLENLSGLIWLSFAKNLQVAGSSNVSELTYQVMNIEADIYSDTSVPELSFTPCSFDDPLYIMYSSGTTGVPKCIVHSIGGTLLQHLKELGLHTDLHQSNRIFYFTTCGWMMWNWLVSSLAFGATLVLYDGSPFFPKPDRLWDIAEAEKIRIFGAGAKFYSACEKEHLSPGKSHDLSSLDALLSTGSPLPHETFDYLYREVKSDICLSSISGGTDIISCFALGNPVLPVYRGELQCLGLGMDVAFTDEEGQPLIGERGELTCQSPFPSMPIGFWNDTDGKKYHEAYFDRFANIWAHGDFGEVVEHQATSQTPLQHGVIIHGRSDAVLNPGGVRIGTAEIYRQVEKLDEILESIVVGQQWQDDERVILFVKTRQDVELNDDLISKIKQTIRANTTPRHVPAKIIAVPDIPRTISGKIVELAVKKIIHGEEVKNKDALANPEALHHFENIAELKS
ncbi:acetoacetate--CoA ligase [Hahella sp. CCB-MM4]|uniref:acetoacetate--CoA ligase n=1 Tax=Hahella sp. (strain CCB-MM4) TaxID=1926491 RepID=UPI000B9A8AFC|nr:acetoacetate--CoA ligase [Hahella sp. CCB-MM4]OZG73386.1 acetoacetate--CoA ligase [Hahella sp. CCB-MM4]